MNRNFTIQEVTTLRAGRSSGLVRAVRAGMALIAALLCCSQAFAQRSSQRPFEPKPETPGDTTISILSFEYIEERDQITYNDSTLHRLDSLAVPDTLVRTGSMGPVFCAQDPKLVSAELTARFDLGEDYQFGKTTFSTNVTLRLIGKSGGGTTVFQYGPLTLQSVQTAPEQVFHVKLAGTDLQQYELAEKILVYIDGYTQHATVASQARLRVSYKEEYAVDAIDQDTASKPLVEIVGPRWQNEYKNPVEFLWNVRGGCNDTFPNYQLQLLRLYNIDTSATYAVDTKCRAVVDWDQALTIETGRGDREFVLTIAEGTGYYVWRVRPIGSYYKGGIANNWNWGAWSKAPADGAVIDLVDPTDTTYPGVFYYQQFDREKNWVYGRAFTEGTRMAEGMTYGTTLGLPVQSQARLQSEGKIIASQTLFDRDGRPVLGSLPTPVESEDGALGYVMNMLKRGTALYGTESFDADSTFASPRAIDGGLVHGYYSNQNSADKLVPSADGYPFVRALASTDGSGRLKEQGGVGAVHRIGSVTSGKDRTGKVYYSSVSNGELISMFGDEAPIDTNVFKVLSVDPNKVVSVEYITLDGNVIATCLEVAQGDSLLTELEETEKLSGPITDTVRGVRTLDKYDHAATKRLGFAQTTQLTMRYRISPDTLHADVCGTTQCNTCSYRVSLILHNVDNPDSTRRYSFVVGGTHCDSVLSIDTTLTVTVPAGTYIVEKRVETNSADPATIPANPPFGATFAQKYLNDMREEIDAAIRANDSIAIVNAILNTGNLDSLYDYLDVDPDSVDSRTIGTECCAITIPIIDPDCAPNGCKDGTPDFERHLTRMWADDFAGGDTNNLNAFFRHDGREKYLNAPTQFLNGKGAFNFMIGKMLAETEGGQPVYECRKLWACWDVIVQSYRNLATTNGDSLNPDFDLLETFLDCAGRRLRDTSALPYDTTRGYLLYAYKYVKDSALTDSLCKVGTVYTASWHNNPDSTDGWHDLKRCYDSKRRTKSGVSIEPFCTINPDSPDRYKLDTCLLSEKVRIENDCRWRCEGRRSEFRQAIIDAYVSAGRPIPTEGDLLCMTSSLIDSCQSSCNLTVYWNGTPAHIDSLGSWQQWAAINRHYTHVAEVSVIDTVTETCPDSTVKYAGLLQPRNVMIASHLNQRLSEFRLNVGIGGRNWNFLSALMEVAPDYVGLGYFTSYDVFVPYGDTASKFEIRDSCELWYVADTVFCGTPEDPHPLVGHLNSYLDSLWGYEIDHSFIWEHSGSIGAAAFNIVDASDWPAAIHYTVDTTYLSALFTCVNGSVELYPMSEWIQKYNPSPTAFGLKYTAYASTKYHAVDAIGLQGSGDYLAVNFVGSVVIGADSLQLLVNSDLGLSNSYYYLSLSEYFPLWYWLQQPFTEKLGRFGQDQYGYLVYYNSRWTTDTTPSAERIFGIRFYSNVTKQISSHACNYKACPSFCFRWVEKPELPPVSIDTLLPETCEETAVRRIRDAIEQEIRECVDEKVTSAERHYLSVCASPDSLRDILTIQYPLDYYHFTLYYHDRLGRVVRTVPPEGVRLLKYPPSTRLTSTAHKYATEYDYNSLGQLVRQKSPDGGESRFWYDQLGRLRFSRNAEQSFDSIYSYTKYDPLGRVIEVGESDDSVSSDRFTLPHNINNGAFPSSGTQRTYMTYTTPSAIDYIDGSPQRNLRNRVSETHTDDNSRTVYSYDIHGNVEWVAQVIPGFLQTNYVRYEYDLISGNMLKVHYNEGRIDGFHHWYEYDADNRMTEVKTSRDGVIWDRDAKYSYYAHGPLKRTELGEDKLQGVDYTYTIQGWLKGINHPTLDQTKDPGKDGVSTGVNNLFAADSFATALGYYKGDYTRSTPGLDSNAATALHGKPLYNGNISSWTSNIGHVTDTNHKYEKLTGEIYRYDQLNRIDTSRFRVHNGTSWDTTSEYQTSYQYDGNGNLKRLNRYGYRKGSDLRMDSLRYHYDTNASVNRLDHVADAVTGVTPAYVEDLENQSASNYAYDRIGNLVEDNSAGSMTMDWDVYGKVTQVSMTQGGNTVTIAFTYDAAGNRVKKEVTTTGTGGGVRTTYYVYDAGGNVMAIYEQNCDPGVGDQDEDGILDYLDLCPTTPNPTQFDTDGDGIGDACDNCLMVSNANQHDLDNDGTGDLCDSDRDGDGIPNTTDLCPDVYGPAPQTDTDGDGVPDICDFIPLNNKVDFVDSDGDGRPDSHDNCLWVDNFDQADEDSDGVGDLCDNCPEVPNADQRDRDEDGIGDVCDESCLPHLVELLVYGQDRVATVKPDIVVPGVGPDTIYTRELGEKQYELKDHLGNVRVVTSDIKLPTATTGQMPFESDVLAYYNHYPFGMLQPGRMFDGAEYRYGFNGMEQDPEIDPSRNHSTSYFRQYDGRLGRWWSNDPVIHEWESPYAAMGDNPIAFVDPYGASKTDPNESHGAPADPDQTLEHEGKTFIWSKLSNRWLVTVRGGGEVTVTDKRSLDLPNMTDMRNVRSWLAQKHPEKSIPASPSPAVPESVMRQAAENPSRATVSAAPEHNPVVDAYLDWTRYSLGPSPSGTLPRALHRANGVIFGHYDTQYLITTDILSTTGIASTLGINSNPTATHLGGWAAQPQEVDQAYRQASLTAVMMLMGMASGSGMPKPVANMGSFSEMPTAIDPSKVRFSQSSIRNTFKDGNNLSNLVDGLKNGTIKSSDIPPIRLVNKNGVLFTLDNRRLEAFKRAGVDVPYRMATPIEIAKESWKFTTTNDGTSIRVRGE